MAKKVKKLDFRIAMEEASRCLLCYDAPCSKACPAGTDPAKFIRSFRFRNTKGAIETIRENNILGGSCSLICPYGRLCEGACNRGDIDRPVKIGALQEYLIEQEKELGMEVLEAPEEKKDGKVACIGSGPASLACATELALEGYDVTVYEAEEKLGGGLTYAIKPARLPQEMIDHDIKMIKNLGVKFVTNKRIDGEKGIKELKEQFDVVHVGVGLGEYKETGNDTVDGVTSASEFLKAVEENDGVFASGALVDGGKIAVKSVAAGKEVALEIIDYLSKKEVK